MPLILTTHGVVKGPRLVGPEPSKPVISDLQNVTPDPQKNVIPDSIGDPHTTGPDLHRAPQAKAFTWILDPQPLFWLNEPDTLIRDNTRQLLECHHGTETQLQAVL